MTTPQPVRRVESGQRVRVVLEALVRKTYPDSFDFVLDEGTFIAPNLGAVKSVTVLEPPRRVCARCGSGQITEAKP